MTALLLLFLAACTTSHDSGDTDPQDGLRNLDNCGTDTDGAPAFFARFACVTVRDAGDIITVHTVDLPPYPTPYYDLIDPNWTDFDTRGGDWHQNPNFLAEKDLTFAIPAGPVAKGITITADMVDGQANTNAEEYPGGAAGVALNGVVLFNATAAPGDDIAEEKYTFDLYEGHPAPEGTYHYHGASPGPLAVLEASGDADLELFGIMCDGTVVLGCTELNGENVVGTLDAQGGHVHDLVNGSGAIELEHRYHTHVCASGVHEYTPEIQYYDSCTR